MKKNKTPKEISEHFSKLGQKSWEARKKAILDKANKNTEKEIGQ
jgi:hypothetical protein